CANEGADEAPGLCLRLVARSHNLFAGILSLEPVVLLEALRERTGLSQEEQSELVSRVCHCAGQRASNRGRLLLAPRRNQGRTARAGTMVRAHHKVRGRV